MVFYTKIFLVPRERINIGLISSRWIFTSKSPLITIENKGFEIFGRPKFSPWPKVRALSADCFFTDKVCGKLETSHPM